MEKGDKINHSKYGLGIVLGTSDCRNGEILVKFKEKLPFSKGIPLPFEEAEFEDREIVDISDCELISKAKVKKETDWKENIGEGVLCHVWNDDQLNPHKNIMIVRKIHPDTGMFNGGWSCVYYKYAEPIKYEDIKKYIK